MIGLHPDKQKLVTTVPDRCRVCYTCVRECPVKAIRILNGQAEVIPERCIGCGNCVKVCSQGAKVHLDSRERVSNLLSSGQTTVACLAPSFSAEFGDGESYRNLVGMIRELGFDRVVEVAFGADLIAGKYKRLNHSASAGYITSDCPAIVNYIEYYHPSLTRSLAPVASPVMATARVARQKYGEDAAVVFIGPCIAKKAESTETDAVLTFRELREMLDQACITPENSVPSDFDPPESGKGSIFPVSRGLLQNVNATDDIADGDFIVAEGKADIKDAIREFEHGNLGTQNLELLCCEGCIMGPGMTTTARRYSRRTRITNYVREKLENLHEERWQEDILEFSSIDLTNQFRANGKNTRQPDPAEIEKILGRMGKNDETDHLNCGACGYDTCIEHAIAIVEGLAETEMCLPYTINTLHDSIGKLNVSNEKLANARTALKQSEKLASMGQLSAGIAHELNNPLGVITMYSNILIEETPADSPIRKDLRLIVEQADRCKNIVGGLLNFARKNQVKREETDLPGFVRRSLDTALHHGNVELQFENRLEDPIAWIDREQMMQVLTNLEKNAIEAMPDGGILGVGLEGDEYELKITVRDTGIGIAKVNMNRIFTPFFTTKSPGKGTGLGLPLIYGIVKMHKGQIHVDSNADSMQGPTGTTFTIQIPRKAK